LYIAKGELFPLKAFFKEIERKLTGEREKEYCHLKSTNRHEIDLEMLFVYLGHHNEQN